VTILIFRTHIHLRSRFPATVISVKSHCIKTNLKITNSKNYVL
jgi:hypothetical protein